MLPICSSNNTIADVVLCTVYVEFDSNFVDVNRAWLFSS
jgi:hypothetical protein